MELVRTIVAHNRGVFEEMRDLNARAGETVVTVPTREQLEQMLKEVFAGARRMADIDGDTLDMLRLPPLDAALSARVKRDNPDTLTLFGRTFGVIYDKGRTPRIALDEITTRSRWRSLPDAGVTLPGGRRVEVVLRLSTWDTDEDTDLVALKRRCEERITGPAWDAWRHGAPVFDLPNVADLATATVVPLQEATWQTPDGQRLPAFGTTAVNPSQYYGQTSPFLRQWFRNRAEAEAAHAAAVAKLQAMKDHAATLREIERLRNEVRTQQGQIKSLRKTAGHDWFGLSATVRNEADTLMETWLDGLTALESVNAWKARATILITTLTTHFAPKPPSAASLDALSARYGRDKRKGNGPRR